MVVGVGVLVSIELMNAMRRGDAVAWVDCVRVVVVELVAAVLLLCALEIFGSVAALVEINGGINTFELFEVSIGPTYMYLTYVSNLAGLIQ